MNGNLRFGQLFGIPFFVNPSWFVVLALGTVSFSQDFARLLSPAGTNGGALLWGLLTTLLLFASVLAHELGHSFAAIAQGIQVKSITLFIFGGLAMLEKDADRPIKSFAIAIAGPLVSFALFFFFSVAHWQLGFLPRPLLLMLTYLATLNLVLGIFNLIPGMPLDGGNVLRAFVWQITGNPNTGLLFASRVGQGLGIFAIALGVLSFLGVSNYGSLWTAFIGLFLLQNAGRTAQSAQVQDKLSGFTAQDALLTSPTVVSGERNLRDFVNNYIIGQPAVPYYLVTDEAGKLQGVVQPDDLKAISTSEWNETPLSAMIQRDRAMMFAIVPADRPILAVINQMEKDPETPLLVVNGQEQVLGLITKGAIQAFLKNNVFERSNPSAPPPTTPAASNAAEPSE